MKKKLLLITFLIAVFVFTLAVSAGAVTGSASSEYGEISYVTGIDEVKGYDTTSRAVLQNADGTYTTYPAYYIFNGKTGTDMRLSFDKLNQITEDSYAKSSLIRIEVFKNSRLNWTFDDCTSLIDIYLPEGTFLHYASFVGCSALKTVKLPSTGVTQIPTDCFSGCYSLESIIIPDTVTSLGDRVFQNCVNLSEIKLPEGYTGIITQDFRKITNWSLERVPVTYIIPKSCKGINSRFSLDNCDVKAIIFTGDENSPFVADVATDAPAWVSKITYANHCEYYYDGVHSSEMKYVFTSFVEDCYMEGICSRCGESEIGESFDPVFNFLGYSTNGKNICVGYTICQNSILKYNEVNQDAKLQYGFVLSAFNNSPINENGEFADKTVNIDLSNEKYVAFDFILKGDFTNEVSASAKISMNLYTIVKNSEDGYSVNYIYGYNKIENDKITVVTDIYETADYVSYNDLNPVNE